jgi:hypothetical protein
MEFYNSLQGKELKNPANGNGGLKMLISRGIIEMAAGDMEDIDTVFINIFNAPYKPPRWPRRRAPGVKTVLQH